jgi:hypothetical protein
VEAKDFTAAKADFDAAGVALVGLSPDPVKKHDKFVKKHELGVALASDESLKTLEAYGVWKEKSMYGRTYMGVERTTVLGRCRWQDCRSLAEGEGQRPCRCGSRSRQETLAYLYKALE